jgi:putative ABC transport system permease protein
MFSIWTAEGTVIGVVKNFHSRSLHNNLVPVVFTLGFEFAKNRVFIRVQGDRIRETLSFIESKAAEVAPGFPFDYSFLDDTISQQYTSDEQTGTLFRYFSALAIIISCLGIVGLASFMAEQRTKEIGIRKTLGASHSNIVLLISKEFVLLVLCANLIAWPIAYYIINRWLQNYAFHANLSLLLFFVAGILTIIIALLSVSFQAFKAAAVKPANSLKYE